MTGISLIHRDSGTRPQLRIMEQQRLHGVLLDGTHGRGARPAVFSVLADEVGLRCTVSTLVMMGCRSCASPRACDYYGVAGRPRRVCGTSADLGALLRNFSTLRPPRPMRTMHDYGNRRT